MSKINAGDFKTRFDHREFSVVTMPERPHVETRGASWQTGHWDTLTEGTFAVVLPACTLMLEAWPRSIADMFAGLER